MPTLKSLAQKLAMGAVYMGGRMRHLVPTASLYGRLESDIRYVLEQSVGGRMRHFDHLEVVCMGGRIGHVSELAGVLVAGGAVHIVRGCDSKMRPPKKARRRT